MYKKFKILSCYILIIEMLFIMTGCGNNGVGDDVAFEEITYPEIAVINTHYLMDAEVDDEETEVEWGAKEGKFTDEGVYEDNKVEWQAPSSSGTINITLRANETTATREIEVKEPPVIPIDYDIYSEYETTYGEVTFENNSGKDITSMELIIIGWNDFNERIQTSYVSEEDFDHYKMNASATDINFEAGTERTSTWYIGMSFINTPTEIQAYVTRIAYSDGTTWELE